MGADQGGVEKNIAAWCGKIERLAASAFALRRGTRLQAVLPNDWSDDFR
ncbi:hypothetical protein GR702_08520 [Novosphingobium sp. FGD1]|uniref:Uncharacterized protein n=1 Tax=Novosphingobium silvae TaxID=2692619 RepID=A0A7X4GFS2_9SPHN|nr:hypothetical protein [Novosphingobium silvae]MYL97812.1 hypothetical protein [Novosphingobium silvae]